MTAPALNFMPKKQPSLKRWVAKKWKPEYERMVAYSALGKSNIEISQMLSRTTVHVSNVLNLPAALELKEKILARMRERTLEDVPSILQKVAQKTAERLQTMIDDDEMFKKSPFAVIDRGMDVLKGIGHLKGDRNGALVPTGTFNQQNNFFTTPSPFLDRLNEGMAASDKAMEIHAPAPNKRLDRSPDIERTG